MEPPRMYVCICNRLNDKAVTACIRAGARSADDVYAAHNVQKQCGQCATMMDNMVDDHMVNLQPVGGVQQLAAE